MSNFARLHVFYPLIFAVLLAQCLVPVQIHLRLSLVVSADLSICDTLLKASRFRFLWSVRFMSMTYYKQKRFGRFKNYFASLDTKCRDGNHPPSIMNILK